MLVTARYQFKTDLVFVLLITLAVIALTLYGIVALLERRLLYWQMRPENSAAVSKQTQKNRGWETAPEKARYVEEEI